MRNYTTKTAALKATIIDTRLLDAKRIDTEKLFVNGESIKEVGINTYVQVYKASDVNSYGELFTNFDTNTPGITSSIGNQSCNFRIINVKVKGYHVTCPIMYEVANAWIRLWEQGDDLTQIYDGLQPNDAIEVTFSLVKNNDIPLQ